MSQISPKVAQYLEEKHIGKLATVMKDGSPHVTPIWYMLDKGKIVVNTTVQRVKYYNIKRDGRVCFLVDSGYPYVIFFGKARIANERDANKDIEALAIRYTGEEQGRKSARERFWKQSRVSIEITPDRVVVDL